MTGFENEKFFIKRAVLLVLIAIMNEVMYFYLGLRVIYGIPVRWISIVLRAVLIIMFVISFITYTKEKIKSKAV